MKISKDGWLSSIRHCLSPHQNERPCEIDAIIVHGISVPANDFSNTAGIDALFLGLLPDQPPVSAHLLIDRTGELTQYVSFLKRAWHAGVSSLAGRENCNDFSIGIELQGSDNEPYTDAQYENLNRVISLLRARYPNIQNARIVGHSEIAPGRKTDPGPYFEWRKLCLS